MGLLVVFSTTFSVSQNTGLLGDIDDIQRYEFRSYHMGSQFRIVIHANNYKFARSAADSAFAMASYLNSIFSDYDSDSELSQLSRRAVPNKYIPVSEHFFRLLETACDVSIKSNGAFDITLGPLTHLWREVIQGNRTILPTKAEIESARERIGYKNIALDSESRSVALNKRGMILDAGGIAKGYTADRMSEVLFSLGLNHTLVDAGGDLVLGDAPPGTDGWEIVIPVHNQDGQRNYITLQLENTAITTSGDFFQFFEHQGNRYSHIIDPSTGIGLTRRTSATVIGGDGARVDAWATALNTLADKQGVALLSRMTNYHARVEIMDSLGISIYQTGIFEDM